MPEKVGQNPNICLFWGVKNATVQYLHFLGVSTIFCCPGAVDKHCPDLGEVQYAQLLWGKIAAISNTKTENDVSTLRCSCKQLLMPAGEENIHPSTWSCDIQYWPSITNLLEENYNFGSAVACSWKHCHCHPKGPYYGDWVHIGTFLAFSLSHKLIGTPKLWNRDPIGTQLFVK